ncbi:MAG: hypothetical protein ABL996_17290 [Micropepsaceae bacterium]
MGSYAAILALGFLPTVLVTPYYDVLPRRMVMQWDTFGNITVIGTRSATVLMIAHTAAAIAVICLAVSIWQRRALVEMGMRRAFLALNLAQIVAINLTCAMIVSDALGLQLTIKPMVPPALALVLFSAGILFRRADQSRASPPARGAAIVFVLAALFLLGSSAIAADGVVGYYAAALGLLAMTAVALPPTSE